jgi:hypothetical protein
VAIVRNDQEVELFGSGDLQTFKGATDYTFFIMRRDDDCDTLPRLRHVPAVTASQSREQFRQEDQVHEQQR